MKDRLKLLRKELNMSQEEFGKRLGVGKSSISLLESGRNNLTEQMIKLICKEFNVDYIWFSTGNGEMFCDTDDDYLEVIDVIMSSESEFHKNLFKTLSKFDNNDILALERMIDKYLKIKNKKAD